MNGRNQPPHALILTAGYGEGHNAAARNLAAALRERGVRVTLGDFFQECYGPVDDLFRWLYMNAINRTPWIWQAFYNGLDRGGAFRGLCWPVLRRLERELGDWIRRARPDLVLSTYPAYPLALRRIFGGAAPFYEAVVVTDSISINRLWHAGSPRKYYVPNEPTREILRARGIAEERLAAPGFPVPLEFAAAAVELPPPGPARVRVLMMVNSTRRDALDTLEVLLRETPWHLTVAVGRNTELLRRAAGLVERTGSGDRAQVLGWTRMVPQLLMTHHLVVTKAGGATTQEAIAAGCPLVINQVIPGQEQGNAELVERLEVGVVALEPEAVLREIRKAVDHGAAGWSRWRRRLHEVGRPGAAREIAADVLASAGLAAP